ncbi:STAS domain-containing protein [Solidesulfovibrio sp.]
MEVTRFEDSGKSVLGISGKCTVEHAAALRDALLDATSSQSGLILDISGVEEADITFLQLMLATALSVERSGGRLTRHGPLSPAAAAAARVSGFTQTPKLKTFFSDEGRDG